MVGVRTFTPFLHVLKIPGRPSQVDFTVHHRSSLLLHKADRTLKIAAGLVTLLTGLGLRWLAATTILSFVVDKEIHFLAGGARAIGRGY